MKFCCILFMELLSNFDKVNKLIFSYLKVVFAAF